MDKTAGTDAMWRAYCAATGTTGDYGVFAFGDSPALAEDLAALVVDGPKRATAGLARDHAPRTDEPLPAPGGHWVMLGGDGTPRGIIRTTGVRVGPMSSVTAAFAWDEGEGDRSRDGWLAIHAAYFRRCAAAGGFAFDPDIETVFERFEKVWPE